MRNKSEHYSSLCLLLTACLVTNSERLFDICYHYLDGYIPSRYVTKPTRSTQPCIPLGSLNRVPALIGWGKGGNVTSAVWQVTLCDPIWHVSSRSGAALVAQTAIRFLTTSRPAQAYRRTQLMAGKGVTVPLQTLLGYARLQQLSPGSQLSGINQPKNVQISGKASGFTMGEPPVWGVEGFCTGIFLI